MLVPLNFLGIELLISLVLSIFLSLNRLWQLQDFTFIRFSISLIICYIILEDYDNEQAKLYIVLSSLLPYLVTTFIVLRPRNLEEVSAWLFCSFSSARTQVFFRSIFYAGYYLLS